MQFIRKSFVKGIIAITIVAVFYLWSSIEQTVDKNLHIYFLDVGQGDSIYLETPGDKSILIDSGPNDNVVNEISNYLPPYKKQIDFAILTHPHFDHLSGFLYLKDYFIFQKVIQMPVEYTSDAYIQWLEFLDGNNVEVYPVSRGDIINIEDDLTFEVLWPKNIEDINDLNLNNTSIVLLLRYKEFSALFMGDAEIEVEEDIVSNYDFEVNVLKVGHHGALTSSSKEFISMLLPQVSVISVGDNNFGHPNNDVIERLKTQGAVVYRTDQEGTIEMISDGERFWVKE